MDDYTPSTEQVREAASLNGGIAVEPDAFNRWLVAHDAKIREQAAQRIEKMLPFYTTRPTRLALRAAAATVRGV